VGQAFSLSSSQILSRTTKSAEFRCTLDIAMRKKTKKKTAKRWKRPRHIPADQRWFWTPEWQAGERQADEDLAAGRYKTFKSAAELIASLKS
jgi:hypothetical protein